MTLNCIEKYFDKYKKEFNCIYNKNTGYIHLTYKNITLLSIIFSDTMFTALYYFSQDLNVFLPNAENIIDNFKIKYIEYKKKQDKLALTYEENLELFKFLFTDNNKNLFSKLSQNDIDIINNFFKEYINYFAIDLNLKNNGIPIFTCYDLSYPDIIK